MNIAEYIIIFFVFLWGRKYLGRPELDTPPPGAPRSLPGSSFVPLPWHFPWPLACRTREGEGISSSIWQLKPHTPSLRICHSEDGSSYLWQAASEGVHWTHDTHVVPALWTHVRQHAFILSSSNYNFQSNLTHLKCVHVSLTGCARLPACAAAAPNPTAPPANRYVDMGSFKGTQV